MGLLNPSSWFKTSTTTTGPVWTVDLGDIKPEFTQTLASGATIEIPSPTTALWGYKVTFRKGPMSIETTYRFPTAKPLAKVLTLAKEDV